MKIFSVWIGLTQAGIDQYKLRREQGGDYSGPMTDKAFNILKRIHSYKPDRFKPATLGGKVWHLLNVTIRTDSPAKAKDALDYMEAEYPGNFIVTGAWHWDGRQVGTQWELDGDGARTGNTTGTPLYPIHPQLYKLLPDIAEGDPEAPTYRARVAGELDDITLLAGQSLRRFS